MITLDWYSNGYAILLDNGACWYWTLDMEDLLCELENFLDFNPATQVNDKLHVIRKP